MAHWRLVVHALDRTGPPMLALSFLRWARNHRPEASFDLVAFRGGDLVDSMVELVPVHVVLDPSEMWDHDNPPHHRVCELRERLARLPEPDATLLVSVSSCQVLPLLQDDRPVVVWSVEQGEDLHWLDAPLGLVDRARRWLAGPGGTADALGDRLPMHTQITVCDEFIEPPQSLSPDLVANCRIAQGVGDDDVLVIGAGIGTARKGIDIFMEVAAAAHRRGLDRVYFSWLGGESDELHWRVRAESRRLQLNRLRWFGTVTDVDRWLAAADIFLHTARLDAFPLVCLHAAAVGTPVVSFKGAGGTEEMFGDTFLGRRYPDVDGTVDVLEQLTNPSDRARCGKRQQHVVSARFTSAHAAPAVMAELEETARTASRPTQAPR